MRVRAARQEKPHRIEVQRVTGTIGLVVTDLDGTLWERPETIPERTLDAIAELERRSIPLLIATGRRVDRPAEATLGASLICS